MFLQATAGSRFTHFTGTVQAGQRACQFLTSWCKVCCCVACWLQLLINVHTLQSPQIFLQDAPNAASELPADDFASAGAVLEVTCDPLNSCVRNISQPISIPIPACMHLAVSRWVYDLGALMQAYVALHMCHPTLTFGYPTVAHLACCQ